MEIDWSIHYHRRSELHRNIGDRKFYDNFIGDHELRTGNRNCNQSMMSWNAEVVDRSREQIMQDGRDRAVAGFQ